MPGWPWPKADRDWLAARLREKEGVPDALTRRFLRQFATGTLNPQPECRVPLCRRGELVRDLRTWAGMHDHAGLAAHAWTADDAVFARVRDAARWAKRLAGWRRRRGDIVRLRSRRWTWLGVRTR